MCKTNIMPSAGLGQYHAGVPIDQVMVDVLGSLSGTPRGNSSITFFWELPTDDGCTWLGMAPAGSSGY